MSLVLLWPFEQSRCIGILVASTNMALVCLNLYYYRTDRAERLVLIKAMPMQVEKVANTLDIDEMTFVSGFYPLEVN